MKDKTLNKLGGTCSVLVGVSYILADVAYLLQPAQLQAHRNAAQFWPAFSQNPTMHTLQHWGFALSAVLSIAAVLAISEAVRPANEGWVRWTSVLAYLGFAVLAINEFRCIALEPTLAAAYVAGDASTQAAIVVATSLLYLDPHAWLQFGSFGLWLLVVNLLALRRGMWPRTLAYVGIAVGILGWLVVAGSVLDIPLLLPIAAGLVGVIAGPIWFIWIGLRLRRANS